MDIPKTILWCFVVVAGCSNSDFSSSESSKGKKNNLQETNGTEESGSDSQIDKSGDGGKSGDGDHMTNGDIEADEEIEKSTDSGQGSFDLGDLLLEEGGLKQPEGECRWSIYFRSTPTGNGQLDSPQFCEDKEYLAGVGYKAYTGAADGVARIYCCPIPGNIKAFERTNCDDESPGLLNKDQHTCKEGYFLNEVDYNSQVNVPTGNGQAQVKCCEASSSHKLEQNNCSWSDWYALETGNETKQCDVGQYAAGLGYDRNADGSNGGRMRLYCCDP